MRSGCESRAKASNGNWDTSEMKELVDQGVQGTLLIPTEPIVLHKTRRRAQEVSNKGQAMAGIQQQSMRQ